MPTAYKLIHCTKAWPVKTLTPEQGLAVSVETAKHAEHPMLAMLIIEIPVSRQALIALAKSGLLDGVS